MRTTLSPLAAAFVAALVAPLSMAQEWPGFRGSDRSGVAEAASPPLRWSDTENLAWRTELPGAGASSPVVAGERVFLTCYSGYGLDRDEPGELSDLVRHLVCVSRESGEILWNQALPSSAEEASFQTMARDHGYATPTPVTDGRRVYAYFGRSGVFAFDMDGSRVWHTKVGEGVQPAPRPDEDGPESEPPAERPEPGEESGGRRGGRGGEGEGGRRGGRGGGGGGMTWGSAASPLLAGELVIVLAADPSHSLRALEAATGKEVWKVESDQLGSESCSPLLVDTGDGATELVVAVSGETWGLDPETGARKWTVEVGGRGAPNATPVADDGIVFVTGGMGGASTAIRAGMALEDGAERIVWTSREAAGIASPVMHAGVVYLVDRRGIPIRIDAETGEVIDKGEGAERLSGGVYASPVLAGGNLFILSREGRMQVFSTGEKLALVATDEFADDGSQFNSSPAIVGNELFVRSDKFLYCLKSKP